MTTTTTNASPPSDALGAAGSQWIAAHMPELQRHFERDGWTLDTTPTLRAIQAVDLCGLQLLVLLRRRTQQALGQCDFRDIPECVRDAAHIAGLDDWLGIEEECGA
ncbi:hypothetical protein [Algiphilus sp.]|uniref:hypothetical protein n=1 Tax=Algiphilus sp. TaxID=1872431 RepID=UPI001CA7179E|nr:hypothetical protein [Algiphilus sp.]MBY8964159.1 hypothetical protein [Algiphilus acroporae]MCI5064064.1 hypothetical protein [Algiphilus sp.]MCI5105040.1 hypothetical protein [Algiphilus sp.]MCR9091190.1 hypothetical protein [Pseudomonadota bacterium]